MRGDPLGRNGHQVIEETDRRFFTPAVVLELHLAGHIGQVLDLGDCFVFTETSPCDVHPQRVSGLDGDIVDETLGVLLDKPGLRFKLITGVVGMGPGETGTVRVDINDQAPGGGPDNDRIERQYSTHARRLGDDLDRAFRTYNVGVDFTGVSRMILDEPYEVMNPAFRRFVRLVSKILIDIARVCPIRASYCHETTVLTMRHGISLIRTFMG